jgi:hypothetical protein
VARHTVRGTEKLGAGRKSAGETSGRNGIETLTRDEEIGQDPGADFRDTEATPKKNLRPKTGTGAENREKRPENRGRLNTNESRSQIRQTGLARNAKIVPAQPPDQSREALDENKNEPHHFTSRRTANNSIHHSQNSNLLHQASNTGQKKLETGLRATTEPKCARENQRTENLTTHCARIKENWSPKSKTGTQLRSGEGIKRKMDITYKI